MCVRSNVSFPGWKSTPKIRIFSHSVKVIIWVIHKLAIVSFSNYISPELWMKENPLLTGPGRYSVTLNKGVLCMQLEHGIDRSPWLYGATTPVAGISVLFQLDFRPIWYIIHMRLQNWFPDINISILFSYCDT